MILSVSEDQKSLLFGTERDALAWKTALLIDNDPEEMPNGFWRLNR
jgi:hypothetical protein